VSFAAYDVAVKARVVLLSVTSVGAVAVYAAVSAVKMDTTVARLEVTES